jgi:hypothetical protein
MVFDCLFQQIAFGADSICFLGLAENYMVGIQPSVFAEGRNPGLRPRLAFAWPSALMQCPVAWTRSRLITTNTEILAAPVWLADEDCSPIRFAWACYSMAFSNWRNSF